MNSSIIKSERELSRKAFGSYLSELRAKRDVTVRDLAHHLEVLPSQVSRIQRGHSRTSYRILSRLPLALGLTDMECDVLYDLASDAGMRTPERRAEAEERGKAAKFRGKEESEEEEEEPSRAEGVGQEGATERAARKTPRNVKCYIICYTDDWSEIVQFAIERGARVSVTPWEETAPDAVLMPLNSLTMHSNQGQILLTTKLYPVEEKKEG